MPRPHFITCPLCGKGFGSASINIHIPQCYEKAIKRWKLDPVGPRPVMPALFGNAGTATRAGSDGGVIRNSTTKGTGTFGFEDQPCGGGVAAARSLHAQSTPSMMEEAPTNMNLHPCSKCGRSFNFDRIAYHESVCKGDQKRRVFDSSKQRCVGGDDSGYDSVFGRPSGGRGTKKKKQLGTANTTSRYTPAPAPKTNWRQQHEEFISAIRSAKLADSEAQNMWGTSPEVAAPSRMPMAPTHGPQRAPFSRPMNQSGALSSGGGSTLTRGMPPPSQRVPPLMAKQSESRKQNIATGGRAAQAKASASMGPSRGGTTRSGNQAMPPQQQQRGSFGGTGDRFGGRSHATGGGGGGGRILNDNTTSIGMLQALGQA